ncbi:hypothetical protein TCAL_07035 [Tigriopus californicus]|uniref:Cytochrome b-c1 complex subunit 9 n=1 Tax=Tigriopus californicus TaxID=6832 RepID=A0A553PAM6_TIGCA|nr:hypothetical protein TCAL_07035 [Tigriopus californicus]
MGTWNLSKKWKPPTLGVPIGCLSVCQSKMSLVTAAYNALGKRTSTFFLSVMVGAFVFERTFDGVADQIYLKHNQGKLWADIKHKYEAKDE